MGYQESLVLIEPQHFFDKMIQAHNQVCKTPCYKAFRAEGLSIITIKKPIFEIAEGTKLLWIVGSREFHNKQGILKECAKDFFFCQLRFFTVETIFIDPQDEKLENIDFEKKDSTENQYIKRESIEKYFKNIGNS